MPVKCNKKHLTLKQKKKIWKKVCVKDLMVQLQILTNYFLNCNILSIDGHTDYSL